MAPLQNIRLQKTKEAEKARWTGLNKLICLFFVSFAAFAVITGKPILPTKPRVAVRLPALSGTDICTYTLQLPFYRDDLNRQFTDCVTAIQTGRIRDNAVIEHVLFRLYLLSRLQMNRKNQTLTKNRPWLRQLQKVWSYYQGSNQVLRDRISSLLGEA